MERNDKHLQSETGEKNLGTDIASEFVLPDYRPEIKRLLRVKAIPLPIDKYIGGSAAELAGTVEFQVLYAATDGSLWCVTQREEYRLTCPIDLAPDFSTANGLVCDVQTETENAAGRVLAPRKLTARCRLHAKVRTLADRELAEEIPEGEADTTERLTGTITSARVFLGECAPFTLSEEILLDGREAPVRVISAEGEVFPSEVKIEEQGMVSCRGEVCLSLLCVTEPEETPLPDDATDCVPASAPAPYILSRRLPFDVEIPVDGAEVNCACCAFGTCSEIAVTVEENRVFCDVTCVLCARAECNEEVPYTRDIYSTTRECEPVFRRVPTVRSLACRNGNFSIAETRALSDSGVRPDAQVIDTDVRVTVAAPECSRGSYLLPGTARFRVLLRTPDGEYSAAEFDVPFRYETPADGADLPTAGDFIARAVMSKARVDGERIALEAEVAVALSLRSDGDVSALSALRTGDAIPRQGAACVICYPTASDTLWSVARRYHAPLDSLLKKNRLADAPAADAPDSLADIPFLVI